MSRSRVAFLGDEGRAHVLFDAGEVDQGPQVNKSQFDKVMNYIMLGKEEGASLRVERASLQAERNALRAEREHFQIAADALARRQEEDEAQRAMIELGDAAKRKR